LWYNINHYNANRWEMKALSIRIADKLYLALKARAKRNDRSLNKEIVRLIRLELEKEGKPPKKDSDV